MDLAVRWFRGLWEQRSFLDLLGSFSVVFMSYFQLQSVSSQLYLIEGNNVRSSRDKICRSVIRTELIYLLYTFILFLCPVSASTSSLNFILITFHFECAHLRLVQNNLFSIKITMNWHILLLSLVINVEVQPDAFSLSSKQIWRSWPHQWYQTSVADWHTGISVETEGAGWVCYWFGF